MDQLQPIYAAIVAHDWLMVFALPVPIFVAFMKQGWVTAWVAAHMKPQYVPWVAVALGMLSAGSADLVAHKPWTQALFDGIGVGVLAVFGHEAVVEGARKGKEIVPEKKPKDDAPSDSLPPMAPEPNPPM